MTPMSASERYGAERVRALASQLRDGAIMAGRRTALDKIPGTLGIMDYVCLVGELLDSVAESGGLPAHDAPPAPAGNPCTLIDLPDTASPIRGARTMASAPRDGTMFRVFVTGEGSYWTVAWYATEARLGHTWDVLLRSRSGRGHWVEARYAEDIVGWLPMRGEPDLREPVGQEVADQFLRLRTWFEFSAMNLQNSTPDGSNPAGYRGAHPCDCESFAADAVDQVEAFALASRGHGPWPALWTVMDEVPVETGEPSSTPEF